MVQKGVSLKRDTAEILGFNKKERIARGPKEFKQLIVTKFKKYTQALIGT